MNIGKLLREAKSIAEASGIVCDVFVHKISQVSMTPVEEVQPNYLLLRTDWFPSLGRPSELDG